MELATAQAGLERGHHKGDLRPELETAGRGNPLMSHSSLQKHVRNVKSGKSSKFAFHFPLRSYTERHSHSEPPAKPTAG